MVFLFRRSRFDAALLARRRFGNTTALHESSRDWWSWQWLEQAWQDLRYAARTFAKTPAFTLTAVLILALGIGANTAVFSIVEAVLLRALPYREPERLVAVWRQNPHEKGASKLFDAYDDFEQYARYARSFESVAAVTWAIGNQALSGRGPAKPVLAIPVSVSFFSTLGVEPSLGRAFTPDDEKRGCAVVLSNRFWQNALGADPEITGKRVTLDRRSCTVLGVMPRAFAFYPLVAEMWTLLGPDFRPPREKMSIGIVGRLKHGVKQERAEAELGALYRPLHQGPGIERELVPLVSNLQDEFTWLASRTLRSTLFALSGAAAFFLLIACLNVANLLLGRSIGREREFSVRAALGAGRDRLVRQLLTEGFLLSALGSGLGVMLAVAAIQTFRYLDPIELPVGADVTLSQPVLLFTAASSVLTTLLFALTPALRASRDSNQGFRAASRVSITGGSRWGVPNTLVAAEMALSVALLAGAGLLIESVLRMSAASLGFNPDGLLTMNVGLPEDGYPDEERQIRFYNELQQRIGSVPGAVRVALSWPYRKMQSLEVDGRPRGANQLVGVQGVSSIWRGAMGVPLLRGRDFNREDGPKSEPVALINEVLVRRYFSGVDPIGRRIRLGDPGSEGPWLTITGIMGNIKEGSLYEEMSWGEPMIVFRPLEQAVQRQTSLVVRVAGDASGPGAAMGREIAALDSSIPIHAVETMNSRLSKTLAYPRFRALLFGAFAGFALLLTGAGLYGVLGQFVAQRRREFAVRMAVGASKHHVFWLVARQGGVPVIAGLAAGIGCTFLLARSLASLIYGVRPAEPLTLVIMSTILFAVACVAMSIPARRATTADPMVTLREE